MNEARESMHDPAARRLDGPPRRRRRGRGLAGAAVVVAGALALSASPAFGEGSAQLNRASAAPGGGFRHGLSVAHPDGAGTMRSPLSVYAQAGETIHMANNLMGAPNANIRVFAPGADPLTAAPVLDCAATQPGRGQIADRAQELAGPSPNAGGYDACVFNATATGIYTVVMYGTSDANNGVGTVDAPTAGPYLGSNLSMWDVTVRSAGADRPGRVFGPKLQLRTGAGAATLTDPAFGSGVQAYVYTRTGYEYQVNFYGHAGVNWIFTSDDKGIVDAATRKRIFASFACGNDDPANNLCVNTNAEPAADFGDVVSLADQHPLFFSRVDPLAVSGPGGLGATYGYATSPISPASAPLSGARFTGSSGQSGATNHGSGGTLAFSSPTQMAGLGYTVAIDTNRDGTFGNASDFVDNRRELSSSGANALAWNGRDAAGNVPQCGDYQYQVRSTLAEVHFTQVDVEGSGGTRIERLTLPGDASLGNVLAASYDNRDPYKNGYVVTNGTPPAATDAVSGPGFNAWNNNTGNTDYIDTWARLPEVTATGTLRLLCADLAITKTATQNPAFPDQDLTYDLVVRNNGPDAAQNVRVTDSLPANVTYVSSSQGCSISGTTVGCTLGSLAVGASHTFKVTVRVAASATGTLENTADVTNDVPDPDPRNNRDDERVPVEPLADLEIVKRALSDRLVPGRQLEYELVVTNHGPSTARDVRVSDPLPRGLSFVSATRGCTFARGTVTCTAASLDSGRSLTYRVVTRVAANVTENSVTNTATVESTTRDPDRTNNRDTERVPSGPEADLSIRKIPSVDRVGVGGQLFYTLVIRNDGPSDAQDVVVTDTAGAGLTLLSARGSQGASCSVTATRVSCRLGTLAVGGSAQVLVSARADRTGELTNTATVDSPTEDPDRRNNRDERRITGDPDPLPQPADLEIVKTSNRRAILGSGTITYTLRVRNLGPGTATDVQVIDTPSLPIKVRSVRSSAGRCTTTVPVRCALGTLRSGASVTIRIVAEPKAPGTLRNSASVTGNEPDPRAENNIDGTATKVQGLLKIKKVASAKKVRAGGTLTYKIKVTNASSFALRSVRVCDDLPSGLVLVSSTPKAKLAKGKHCWTIRALGAKKSKTFTLKARVLKGAGGRKVNVATATAPNARGARSRAAADSAPIQVIAGRVRSGGVTG